jgi:hypothetical protein
MEGLEIRLRPPVEVRRAYMERHMALLTQL